MRPKWSHAKTVAGIISLGSTNGGQGCKTATEKIREEREMQQASAEPWRRSTCRGGDKEEGAAEV